MVQKIRLGCWLVLLAGLGWGQQPGQDTIYTTAASNLSSGTTTTPITNIGQTSHQIVVMASGTCTGTLSFLVKNSSSESYKTLATKTLTSATTTAPIVFTMSGLYPFVETRVNNVGSGSCVMSATYVGTKSVLAPFTTEIDYTNAPALLYTPLIGGVQGVGKNVNGEFSYGGNVLIYLSANGTTDLTPYYRTASPFTILGFMVGVGGTTSALALESETSPGVWTPSMTLDTTKTGWFPFPYTFYIASGVNWRLSATGGVAATISVLTKSDQL